MKLLKQFLKEGGVINGVELIDNKLYYEIDTGMKSSFKIHPSGHHCYWFITRYGGLPQEEVFDNVKELVNFIFAKCRYGRDYMSASMSKLVKKYVPEDKLKARYTLKLK